MIILLVVVPVIVVTSDVFAHPTSIAALHADDSVFHTHGVAPEAVGAVAALVAALVKLAPDLALTLKRGHVAADHIGIEDAMSGTWGASPFGCHGADQGSAIASGRRSRNVGVRLLPSRVAAPRLVQTGGCRAHEVSGILGPRPGNRLQDRRI